MTLIELYIEGFGEIYDYRIILKDGLNIIYGQNAEDNSTLHAFIRIMFFGLPKGEETATYTRFSPWGTDFDFGGYIRFMYNSSVYRLERNFRKDPFGLILFDETKGQTLNPTPEFMDELNGSFSETAYHNSINFSNIAASKHGVLSITNAIAFLENQKQVFRQLMVPEIAGTYNLIMKNIIDLEKNIFTLDRQNQQNELQQKAADINQVLADNAFTDTASIRTYQDETNKIYEGYRRNLEICESKTDLLGISLFILFTVFNCIRGIMAMLRAGYSSPFDYLALIMEPMELSTIILMGIFCFLIFYLALFVPLRRKRKYKRELQYTAKILHETFLRFLSDTSISDQAMKAFANRIEEMVKLREVLTEYESTLAKNETELAMLIDQQDFEQHSDDLANYKDQAEVLKKVLAKNDSLEKEMESVEAALLTLSELSASVRSSYDLYVNETASELITKITGGACTGIMLDDDLNVLINTRTKPVPITTVNSSNMDQINLALRLVTITQAQLNHEQMPLIFGNTFLTLDEGCISRTLHWLTREYDGQVIVLTSQQRETEIMTQNQIKHHFVKI